MNHLTSTSGNGGAGYHLFITEELSDVTILAHSSDGNPWRFPVHSLILSSQSVVFRKMLSSDFCEKNNHQIVIEDIKPKIVEVLLGYIYCGKVNHESWRDALDLLQASHKYQIEPLVKNCARFLENVINIDNVLYIYNEAFVYSLMQLKEKCLKLILDAGFILLRSKAFEMLNKDSVLDLVTNSSLNIDSELTVFEALLRWAPMQCCRMGCLVTETNILNALEPFLKYVCFDDMSDTEKSALPAAVLSCVKPNNRNRVNFCVPDSLLPYTFTLNFSVDLNELELIGDRLCCVSFSIDSCVHMVGMKFAIVTAETPHHFPFTLVKEGAGTSNIASNNMYSLVSSFWKEGLQMNDRQCYETLFWLRQPCRLDPKVVYKLYTMDRRQNAQCPKVTLCESHKSLKTENRQVNISLHSENVWGILGFSFI